MKKFYSEMWENNVRGGDCEISGGLFMHDGLIETAKCIWVNIWCMLD